MEENKKNKIPNVPNLRFPHEGEWIKYKLKEISKIYDGTHQTPDYKKEGIRFVSVEDIKNLYSSNKFISKENYKRDFKIVPEKGDILMTRIGDIGTPAIVDRDEPLAYYVSLALIKPKNLLDNAFGKQLIQTPSFRHELWKKTIHVAFPKKINKDEIGECACYLPDLVNQKEIGNFLRLLDKRIETQNKIIEELKTLKAAISDLIFKALKCENIIIEKLCSITTGKLDANAGNPNGKYRFYTCAEEYSFIDNYSFDCEAILISGNGANVGYVHQYSGKFNAYQRTYVLYDFKGISPTYLKYYLEVFLKQKINAEKNTGNTPYIRLNTIAKMAIKKPDKTTQEKIVSALDKISEKLSIEIRKIDLFKKQKSYFLSNLFI